MVMVSGQQLAEKIQHTLQTKITEARFTPRAVFIVVAPTAVTKRYLSYKQAAANSVGITTEVVELSPECDTATVVETVRQVAKRSDAIVVQLPLPVHLDTDEVLAAIPATHDVDALRPAAEAPGPFRSPVAAAVAMILATYAVPIVEKLAVVVGAGRLVGKPVASFLEQAGAEVHVVTEQTVAPEDLFQQADIIVLGAGVPGLLRADMVQSGVVIIDAATSEQAGRLSGDADPACATLARVFTPVPGGIGPITIATLLVNIFIAAGGEYASDLY